ncbi:GNAT family N-acetyltransferase [Ruminococcus sp.]|uniref:GNAT family N-acetyltransferase n=1 Tax=Ruminococcus sp. TaxID=41978 RepID=UPI003F06ECBB
MEYRVLPVGQEDLAQFKRDMQEAFQQGAAKEFALSDTEILPEKDIDESLRKPGAIAYQIVGNGPLLGGAIVVIDPETQHNHLDFLYVKYGIQSRGIGQRLWREIERLHPETIVWETCTPYFEKRNIHFYINRLGFHAVEFFNPHHKDPSIPEDMIGGDYFFRFEKQMKCTCPGE